MGKRLIKVEISRGRIQTKRVERVNFHMVPNQGIKRCQK